jgi:predicted  nucleic acid-binding Zn-ribbon protein
VSGFDELLRLQDHDIVIDQITHRQATLPERPALTAATAAVADIDGRIAATRARRDELARDEKRIADEVAIVEAKATDVNDKLYGGTITSPKELQAFQEDYDSLKRRQRELEDHEIEIMEQIEPVEADLTSLDAERATLEAAREAAVAALGAAEAAVGAELAAATGQRDEIVAAVPAEQLQTYDRLRPDFAGIPIARLVGSNCNGCHLTLSAVAIDRIHALPPDALATCEECGRILVR